MKLTVLPDSFIIENEGCNIPEVADMAYKSGCFVDFAEAEFQVTAQDGKYLLLFLYELTMYVHDLEID